MTRFYRSVTAGFVAVLLFPALSVSAEESLTLPAGSTLYVRLITTLSTRTSENGDPFSGKIIEPIIYDSVEVVPAGSILEGRVAYVKQPGKVKGVGEMRLVAETITTPDEIRYSISAGLEEAEGAEGAKVRDEEGTIKGPASKKDDAIAAGVGAGVGAAAGAITAGGKGSLYGAGIGAAVMGVRSLFKRGKDIILPQGTELTFVIDRTTTAKRVPAASDSSTE